MSRQLNAERRRIQLRLIGNAEGVAQCERQPGLVVFALQADALIGLQLTLESRSDLTGALLLPYCIATRSKPQRRS
nr:hypothetical protein [Stenotrophomonas maltophilia]